jgi:hypothetical protein
MRVSNRAALVLLVATLVPVADFVVLCAVAVASQLPAGWLLPDPDRTLFRAWVAFHLSALAWSWALAVVYWALVFRVPGLSWPRQALWVLGLFWVSGATMPVFWYRHVWGGCRAPGDDRECLCETPAAGPDGTPG